MFSDNKATTSSKHSLTSNQRNLSPDNKPVLTSVFFFFFNPIQHVWLSTKEITEYAERQKNKSEETEQATESDSYMAEILEFQTGNLK